MQTYHSRDNSLPYLFIHGGPGLNSYAEETLLGPQFKARDAIIEFWNEPSRLRPSKDIFSPENAFCNAYSSLETQFIRLHKQFGLIHLIAHSFGTQYVVRLAKNHPEKLASVTLIAPGLAIDITFKNVMHLAQKDLTTIDLRLADQLRNALEKTKNLADPAMIDGLLCSLQDPLLFSHYWSQKKSHETWMDLVNSQTEAAFDLESFLAILKTIEPIDFDSPLSQSFRVRVYFGRLDPIADQTHEKALLNRLFRNAEVTILDHCSHFAHLEDPAGFAQIVIHR